LNSASGEKRLGFSGKWFLLNTQTPIKSLISVCVQRKDNAVSAWRQCFLGNEQMDIIFNRAGRKRYRQAALIQQLQTFQADYLVVHH
jgi:hypothetical protein